MSPSQALAQTPSAAGGWETRSGGHAYRPLAPRMWTDPLPPSRLASSWPSRVSATVSVLWVSIPEWPGLWVRAPPSPPPPQVLSSLLHARCYSQALCVAVNYMAGKCGRSQTPLCSQAEADALETCLFRASPASPSASTADSASAVQRLVAGTCSSGNQVNFSTSGISH